MKPTLTLKVCLAALVLNIIGVAHAATRYVEVGTKQQVGPKLSVAKTEVVTTKFNFKGKDYEESYVVTTFTNSNKCYRHMGTNVLSCVKNAGE